jgi:EmrB/QacA subfamily drug resistance transporter
MSADTVRSKPLALALLAVSQFMIVLDVSIVNVAMPSIQDALDFSPENLSWVVNAYALMFGGFLLLGGRFADLFGRRRLFIIGMTIFGLASLVGGLATSELQLIIARAAQGFGAAIVSPAALSTVSVIFKEGAERNKALGVWGAVAGSGGAVGVLLGGILTQWLGWEWILIINVPVAFAAALLAPRLLIESREPEHRSHDIPGAVTITAGLLAIVYAIVDATSAGWGSFQTIGLLALGVTFIALFVVIELTTRDPLISFSIFKLRTLRSANVIAFVNSASLLAMFYALTLYLQRILGFSALETGLSIMPLSVLVVVFAGVASNLVTRIGFKPTLIIGTTLWALGLGWLTQVSADGSYVSDVLGPTLLAGAGLGFTFVSLTIAALTGTDDTNAGLGSGLINTSQQIGAAVGVAILISVYTSESNSQLAAGAGQKTALFDGLALGLLVCACVSLLTLVLSVFAVSSRDSKAEVQAAQA